MTYDFVSCDYLLKMKLFLTDAKNPYWGDPPSIEQTLEMIKTQKFDFVHPKRL